MFYEPGKTDHGLPHDPFKACVVPRPIGWISTVSPHRAGEKPIYNLAPFSQFNNLTFDPPYVMFSSNQTSHLASEPDSTPPPQRPALPGFHRKDTVHNVESTGYFCWQLATYELREAVNASAQALPYEIDEFEKAGLEKEWSTILPIGIPMVKKSPVKFECQYHQTIRLPGNPPFGTVDIVFARVLGVHIADSCISEGKMDVSKTKPIARLGYYDYAVIKESFQMIIPGSERALGGLEGSTKWNREMAAQYRGQGQEKEKDKEKEIGNHLQREQSQDHVPMVDGVKTDEKKE